MQAAVAAHEQVQARQEAGRRRSPPAAEAPAASERGSAAGHRVFEPPPTKAFQPSAWTPGGGGAAARARPRDGGGRRARPLDGAAAFRVLGLQQVAIGGVDKAPLSALWEGLLGVPKAATAGKENVDDILARGAMHVELDLMQPIDPAKAPKVHVPTLNHIGIWVHLLDKAVAHLEQGVRFTPGGIRKAPATTSASSTPRATRRRRAAARACSSSCAGAAASHRHLRQPAAALTVNADPAAPGDRRWLETAKLRACELTYLRSSHFNSRDAASRAAPIVQTAWKASRSGCTNVATRRTSRGV